MNVEEAYEALGTNQAQLGQMLSMVEGVHPGAELEEIRKEGRLVGFVAHITREEAEQVSELSWQVHDEAYEVTTPQEQRGASDSSGLRGIDAVYVDDGYRFVNVKA